MNLISMDQYENKLKRYPKLIRGSQDYSQLTRKLKIIIRVQR